MAARMITLFLVVAATVPAAAATYTANSCNLSDVQNVLTNNDPPVQAGDTVVIPSTGSPCTWTSTLTVSIAIILTGQTATPATIIDNVSRTGCHDNPMLWMDIPANLPWQLTTLTIQGMSTDTGGCAEHVKVTTNSHSFRVDHLTFNNQLSTGIQVNGDAWGLLDHNTFNGDHKRGVLIHHTTWGGVGAWGDNSWAQPDTMGTIAAVFVEDSTFNITHALGSGSVACEDGGRAVVRHTTLPYIGTHGTDSDQRMRSCRHIEVYSNVITDNGTQVSQVGQLRGGTSMFFNNTITPTVAGSYATLWNLEIYREVDAWTPWGPASNGYKGGCDGTGPFDNNDNVVYDSGTYTGNTVNDTLTDAKTWTPGQWVGYSLRNTSVPWGASIWSNTATTITTYPASMGSPHTWTSGNGYQILKVYPCLDQPGRGLIAITGGGYATSPTGGTLDPIYAWGNTLNSNLVPAISAYYTHVQANRDYYDWVNSFDGSVGVGQGTLTSRPPHCTPLTAYWATDTNTLYQCQFKDTWATYYQPYVYPHPLNH